MERKKVNFSNRYYIQEPYKTEYEKAAHGKWYYKEYWTMSHLERRQANPQKMRHPLKETV